MKNLTKRLFFVITIFKITSSCKPKDIEWGNRKIENEELQQTIKQSVACPFDLASPFTKPEVFNVIISKLDGENGLQNEEEKILYYKKEDKPAGHVIVTVLKVGNRMEIVEESIYERTALEAKEEKVKRDKKKEKKETTQKKRKEREITKEDVWILSRDQVYEVFDGQGPFAKYWKHENGKIVKEINDSEKLLHVVSLNDKLNIIKMVSKDGNLDKRILYCRMSPQRDNIISFKSTGNNFIQTTVLYEDGSWFHAISINDTKDRLIIMGFHNHENYLDSHQSDEFSSRFNMNYSGNGLTVESGLFTYDEALFSINADEYGEVSVGGFIGNYVKITYRLEDGRTHLKLYKNFGIIILTHSILVNRYYPCGKDPAFTYWLRSNFQKVDDKSLVHVDNSGFLVYITPKGEMYRTSNSEFIEHYVYNENDQLPHNCCVTSYTGIINDQLITIKKNYGIIENGNPIKKSRYIIDHETAMEYASPDSSINIKWNK